MASADVAYSRGVGGVEGIWKVPTELQQARNLRRMSQPTLMHSYRRDSITREPFQSYRRDSVTRDSVRDYRNGSVTRDAIPNYRRDSITKDSSLDYRRTSVTSEPYQNYRRDSITRDPISNYRRDSLTRDSTTTESTQQSNGATGRRGSDADDINWIEKYKRSDHHADRLVSKKLDHEKAMAESLSGEWHSTARCPPRSPYSRCRFA